MRLITFLTLIVLSKQINAQGWSTTLSAGFVFELMKKHAPFEEFFTIRDSSFTIEQYKLSDTAESPVLSWGILFSFLNNDMIKMQGFDQNIKLEMPTYWKLITKNNDSIPINAVECNSKGIIKHVKNFKTSSYIKIKNDSIVEEISWRISGKFDTTANMLCKWVFTMDTLKEFWRGVVLDNNPNWETQEIYSKDIYSYPRNNVIIVKSLLIIKGKTDTLDNLVISKNYNQFGRISSINYTYSNQPKKFEDRYFYENGKWQRTESWEGDKLYEIFKKNHR